MNSTAKALKIAAMARKKPERRTTGAPVRALKNLIDERLMEICREGPRLMDVEPKKLSTKDILDRMLSGMSEKERIDRLGKILADKNSSLEMRDAAREEMQRIMRENDYARKCIW